MQRIDNAWVFSASDLVGQMGCAHSTLLRQATGSGLLTIEKAPADPNVELAAKYGLAHENVKLEQLIEEHGTDQVVRIEEPSRPVTRASIVAASAATRDAIAVEAPVIFQAVFFDGEFYGIADFLVRTPLTGGFGYTYEAYDTKLARSAKPSAMLQLAAYSDQLASLGLVVPRRAHLWLGDGTTESFQVNDLLPLLRQVRSDLRAALAVDARVPEPLWAEKRPACGVCAFSVHCETGREEARDLSLVAGMRGTQRRKLIDAGLATIDALAAGDPRATPERMADRTFTVLQSQAALQVRQDATRTATDPAGTVFSEVIGDEGFSMLPAPDPGDIFFDMEGDPYVDAPNGLEYLFGVTYLDDPAPTSKEEFIAFWAHTRVDEKHAFEQFMDYVTQRRLKFPSMHVYHYAAYERTALTRLAQFHGTREEDLDDLLRAGVLVDLYRVVKKSIRVSQRSYSIKQLEPLYAPDGRSGDVTTAADSILQYEAAVAARACDDEDEFQKLCGSIEAYNKFDCDSTLWLRDWLLVQAKQVGIRVGRGDVAAKAEPERAREEPQVEREEIYRALLDPLPEDQADWTNTDRVHALIAHSVKYHQREGKPQWWEHFNRIGMTLDELEQDDHVVVPDHVTVSGDWDKRPGNRKIDRILELTFDHQTLVRFEEKNRCQLLYLDGGPLDNGAFAPDVNEGTVTALEPGRMLVREILRASDSYSHLPVAVLPSKPISTSALVASLLLSAKTALASGSTVPAAAGFDVVAALPPRTAFSNENGYSDDVDRVCAAVRASDNSYVAVQGPPGAGKTYVGSHVIARLVTDGWRIGVVAPSHKATENLLDAVIDAGISPDRLFKAPKIKSDESKAYFRAGKPWEKAAKAHPDGGYVVGGTAWTFVGSQISASDPIDLLVVDEAGQFALADTLADSRVAKRLLLLGDPQQLPQVVQGTHPVAIDASTLTHLSGGFDILPDDVGIFLKESWRMHPEVCRVVSNLSYDGLLQSNPITLARSLEGIEPGVHAKAIDHVGRSTSSPEEVTAVVNLISSLLGKEWTGEKDVARPLGETDILVLAPYNLQVLAITRALRAAKLLGVRVGTVDKFQGQEAPVVVMSMTASSSEDVPRGLEFLLSRNRLNVAISRAQWVTYIAYSPRLAQTAPTSVTGYLDLSRFLGVLEG